MALWEAQSYEDVAALAAEHGVDTVECLVTDTWGIPRGKRLPLRQFLRGSGFAIGSVIYSWDPRCGIRPTPWVDDRDGCPDVHAVPDLTSFRLAGWTDGLATVMCDTVDLDTGEPVALDARQMLKRTVGKYLGEDLHPQLATELEFQLYTSDWQPLTSDISCYSAAKAEELEPVVGDMRRALLRTGMEVEASNMEYGPGQVEINLRHGPALRTADDTVLFKHVVRHTARRHGLNATFMAKPRAGVAGNGMHVHQSINGPDGTNLFGRVDSGGPIDSELARRYLAGLLAHHKELQLVATPTLNGFKRLEDYSFSPTQVTWGLDNRLVGVRCVDRQGPANRLEVRWAAADANPYLVLTGCLEAGWHGLHADLPLLDVVDRDPHVDPRWERLPDELEQALATFESSRFTASAFGATFVQVFAAMQRHELAAYARHIGDWELGRYRDVL